MTAFVPGVVLFARRRKALLVARSAGPGVAQWSVIRRLSILTLAMLPPAI
jgi:hypothetical protein